MRLGWDVENDGHIMTGDNYMAQAIAAHTHTRQHST